MLSPSPSTYKVSKSPPFVYKTTATSLVYTLIILGNFNDFLINLSVSLSPSNTPVLAVRYFIKNNSLMALFNHPV